MKTHHPAETSGFCPRCVRITARPEQVCARCGHIHPIFHAQTGLCQPCYKYQRFAERCQQKRIKTPCSVCGKLRSSVALGRAICAACWRHEQWGTGKCAQCNKEVVIFQKRDQLCKQCHKERQAPTVLRNYLDTYTTPYPYNNELFALLATMIDWERVGEKVNRRFHIMGRYLQTTQLPNPLTWVGIEAALPSLPKTNRYVPKMIRASLFDIGHLLVAQGKLEPRQAYMERRGALLPLERAPEVVQPILSRYVDWLWERRATPNNVREHVENLTVFWLWACDKGVVGPSTVQEGLVNDYLTGLYWQWQCSHCEGVTRFEVAQRRAPVTCHHCNAVRTLTKVPRYSQNTVRNHRGTLVTFFDWAKLERLCLTNPVQRRVPALPPRIQHYDTETVKRLCAYIVSPDADPVEALLLYLILFHALTVQELRSAQLPNIVALRDAIPDPSLGDAYYIVIPQPPPSLGDKRPGRPDPQLVFPAQAAEWLQPLLNRFEQHRKQVVQTERNRYLLVSRARPRHDAPVGHTYVWQIVRQATIRVLGAACSPNVLRKTGAVLCADKAGAGILRWMGWSDQQAFAYAWAPRETLFPQPVGTDAHTEDLAQTVVFPAPSQGAD
jgi:hypothetical protein